MSGPVKQRRLVLDRQHLIAMVSDPEFYVQCPAFAWMAETAMHTARLYHDTKSRRCCGGDWSVLRPAVDGLFTAIKDLHAKDPTSLETVRDYLERKKGYRPQPVVIYYRAQKQGAPNKFQF